MSGNDAYDARVVRDRFDAATLALSVIQATAAEWNALRPVGAERVQPERTQYTEGEPFEFEGQIIVEWSLFMPGMEQSSARVTVVNSEAQEQLDEGFVLVVF